MLCVYIIVPNKYLGVSWICSWFTMLGVSC